MADNLITTTTTEPTTKKQPQFDGSLFTKRIEFHPSRKPFTGFSKGSSDFHLETLNSTNTTISPKKPIGGYSSSSSSPTSAGKRQDGGEDLLEQHGLDPELSFGITFGRIGAGLENLGNTCFLNSVLQCLTYTEPFAAYLQSGKHKSSWASVASFQEPSTSGIKPHRSPEERMPSREAKEQDQSHSLVFIDKH